MDRVIDSGVEMLNAVGQTFCFYAWRISIQVSVLIAVLLVLDLLLRRHVRAVVRYAMWMLVFVKLLLPPTLSLPTGIGYYRPEHKAVSQKQTEPVVEQPAPPVEVRPVHRESVVVSPPTVDVSHANVVPAPAAPAVVRPAITWQGLVFLGWLAGVLTLSVYLLRRVQYVRKLIHRSTPPADALADVLTQCAAVLRLRSCPALRLSDDAPGPAVCGLFRPVVLIPASMAENLSGERLRTVLVHELAHVRRADLWVNFAQTLLLVAYFYHPLLWLANAIVRRLREQAVDETVLVALDAEAESYGTILIDLAEMTFHRPALGLRLIGIAESKKALEGRIRHMITRPKPRTAKLGLCGLLAVALAAAALLPMARAKTEAEKLQFIARLSNGVTVELLGVCNRPTQEAVCWKPDGSPLAPPLRATKAHVGPASDRYGFMLRVAGPDDLEIRWNTIEGADSWEGSCDVVTSDGTRLDDCTAAVASMKAGQQQTTLRIGIATGPWATISTHDGKGMSSGKRSGVLWSQAFADSGGTYIVATAEWIKDRTERIIAIDADGVTHAPPGGSVASGNMDQMTTRFPGLEPGQIREFQYQVRPYEWAQFKNVSLRPGRMTSVAVEPIAAERSASGIGADSDQANRDYSRAQLMELGKTLLIYANDYADKYPDTLENARDSIKDNGDLPWVLKNIAYLGNGLDPRGDPGRVLAYDKTLLVEGKGTNVLYVDARVEFVTPERLKELVPAKAVESLLDIFILSPSRVGFNVFDAVNSRTQDWTWNKTGRYHDKETYDKIFDGTDHRMSHGILVLVFTLDSEDRIPAGYEDLLPMPWGRIEQTLRQGQTVEMAKEARGLHVILLAAPDSDQLKRLIAGSKLLADSKEVARSAVTGCDVAIEDFKVRADPDLGTFAAIVSIRNRGVAACPKIAVYFYRGDPEIATPMMHGAGPLEPGQTWNEVSSQFALREGANEVSVVLDPGNLVAEPDETNNRATLRIVIRNGQITEQSIVPAATSAVSAEARAESATRLSDLGKTLLIYANDHDDKLPDELTDVRRQYGVGFSWLYDNVGYLGKGMTVRRDRPKRPTAYDKTLIRSGTGTNVLYLDTQVAFESPARLEELGIRYEPKQKSAEELRQEAEIQARVTVLSHLKQVALAAHLYASDNDGVFPDALEMLEPYLAREEGLWVWVRENVEYTGKGLNPANVREPSSKPIAHSRLASDQAAVAFVDGHVEYVTGPRLKELGIEIER